MNLVTKVLEEAKARIEQGWCKESLAVDDEDQERSPHHPRSVAWCALGGLLAGAAHAGALEVCEGPGLYNTAVNRLRSEGPYAAQPLCSYRMPENRCPYTWAEELFYRAALGPSARVEDDPSIFESRRRASALHAWNDDPQRRQPQVLAALDEAITLSEKETT